LSQCLMSSFGWTAQGMKRRASKPRAFSFELYSLVVGFSSECMVSIKIVVWHLTLSHTHNFAYAHN
jgi:diacylglycerol kinase